MRKVSSVTDYFVVASSTSEPHLRAIVSEITDELREKHDVRPTRVDTPWRVGNVPDFFDVIVHVMRADVRERYDLKALGRCRQSQTPQPKSPVETVIHQPSKTTLASVCGSAGATTSNWNSQGFF